MPTSLALVPPLIKSAKTVRSGAIAQTIARCPAALTGSAVRRCKMAGRLAQINQAENRPSEAEGEGFEPSSDGTARNGFRDFDEYTDLQDVCISCASSCATLQDSVQRWRDRQALGLADHLFHGRYWDRTSDHQLVDLRPPVLGQRVSGLLSVVEALTRREVARYTAPELASGRRVRR